MYSPEGIATTILLNDTVYGTVVTEIMFAILLTYDIKKWVNEGEPNWLYLIADILCVSTAGFASSVGSGMIKSGKNIIFKSGSNFIGEISTAGNLTFISGSVNFGNNSSNNTINGNLTVKGYLSASAISCSGDIIAFSTSDERLKDNITPLSDNLNKLDMINAYNFDWKPNAFRSGKDVGVLAQEIEKIMPEAVITRDTGYTAVDYQKLIGFLIGCVKELKQKLDEK